MPNKKITELQLLDEITGDESFPTDDGIQTYRATAAQIRAYSVPFVAGGDLLYAHTDGTPRVLTNGTAGQYLESQGTTAAPLWKTFKQPSSIRLDTPNGFGAVNTKIRRMTNVVSTSGSDVTYADTSNNGTSLTINTTGVYTITYQEEGNSGAPQFGLTLNSANLSTDINSLGSAILIISGVGTGNDRKCVSWTGKLTAGDIVRPHTNESGSLFVTANIGSLNIAGPFIG